MEKKIEYGQDTFDIVVTNLGNIPSSGNEVHQIFNKVVTSLSSSFLLSPHTVFNLITDGEPTENSILVVNYANLDAVILDSNKLKLNNPIQPNEKIIITIMFESFVPFIVKVDSEDVIEEQNINLVDAEANNIVVVDQSQYITPTPTIDTPSLQGESFAFGLRENTTGGVAENPTWLLGPKSFSVIKYPILDLGNNRIRVYINEKLKNGSHTGKIDWIALPEIESDGMYQNIVVGANQNENENMIVNKIISSSIHQFMVTIISGRLTDVGWSIELDTTDGKFINDFDFPQKVEISNVAYYLQKVGSI